MNLILSFDVGIIHLAYCLFTKENNKLKIIEWNNIDLTDRDESICYCGLKASFIQNDKFYCKVHSKKLEKIKTFDELYNSIEKNNDICKLCNKKCSKIDIDNTKYCLLHAKTLYKTKEKELKIKNFKNKNIRELDFDTTRLKLFKILEEKKELLKANIVCIENQPSFKNPIMKSIANALYDFYLIRGVLDKETTLSNINIVKFIAPCNKIKLVSDEESKKIIISKSTDDTTKYKLTKSLSVKYAMQLINHLPEWLEFFNKQKKKDDLADALLQGMYYYEKNFI